MFYIPFCEKQDKIGQVAHSFGRDFRPALLISGPVRGHLWPRRRQVALANWLLKVQIWASRLSIFMRVLQNPPH